MYIHSHEHNCQGSVSYKIIVTGATSEFINTVLYLISIIYTNHCSWQGQLHPQNDGSLASNQFSSSHATHLNMVELNNVFSMQSQQLKNFNLSLQIHLNFGVLLKIFLSYHLDCHLHCTSLCATCKSLNFIHGINFIILFMIILLCLLKDTYRIPSQQHFPK